jgi:hypothetical protein
MENRKARKCSHVHLYFQTLSSPPEKLPDCPPAKLLSTYAIEKIASGLVPGCGGLVLACIPNFIDTDTKVLVGTVTTKVR